LKSLSILFDCASVSRTDKNFFERILLMAQPFVLGVNYWTRQQAMYMWQHFNAQQIDEDFALIRELGMTLVRVFLLWDDFQPVAQTPPSETNLQNLHTMAQLALKYDLKLDVTFFTGHMSGPNWSPRWLLGGDTLPLPKHKYRQVVSENRFVEVGYRNPFHDDVAIASEDVLLHSVVNALKDTNAVGLWNLGNEPDLFAEPHDAPSGKAWVQARIATIRQSDPTTPITCGLHADSLWADNGLRVNDVFGATDVAVMHAYPMYISWAKSPLDPDFVPFTAALTSALCGKPTLMEEWGGCTNTPGQDSAVWSWTREGKPFQQFMAGEEEFAEYIGLVLPKLVEVGSTGSLMWCFADYIEALWDKPPCDEAHHERFFGLVRPDGSLKPHAKVIQAFAKSKPMVQPATRTVPWDITPDEYYQAPMQHAQRLYEMF
jgi:endo-1,4-beta-mannosidase